MGYENSVIYKMEHEDGHFYYGSTFATMRERLRKHKVKSIKHPDRRVYQHINGEWDKVRMIEVDKFPCETKEQLRKREDEFIQRELKNPLCLNHCRAFGTDGKASSERYHKTHKDTRNVQSREYNAAHKEEIAGKRKARRDHDNELRRELRARKKFEAGEAFMPRGPYKNKVSS